MINQTIKVRMLYTPYPCYDLTVLTEPVRVVVKVNGLVIQHLYTCTVLWDNEPKRVYLSVYDWVNTDYLHLCYWDTPQTLPDFWLDYLVDKQIAQTAIDLYNTAEDK